MVSRVSWVISIVMLARAIRVLSVVTITPVISGVWMLLGLSELIDLLVLLDFWGCTAIIVIRVFKPRAYLSVIRVSSVNIVVMVIMIIRVQSQKSGNR